MVLFLLSANSELKFVKTYVLSIFSKSDTPQYRLCLNCNVTDLVLIVVPSYIFNVIFVLVVAFNSVNKYSLISLSIGISLIYCSITVLFNCHVHNTESTTVPISTTLGDILNVTISGSKYSNTSRTSFNVLTLG